jgi:RimJ/RimL family protein N-acetyltransferase
MDFKSKLKASLTDGYLKIKDAGNNDIAILSIVSESDLDDHDFIRRSTEWREKVASCFFTVFKPTPERTRKWMETSLLPNPDRVMCKIYTTDMKLVGHVGAINHGSHVEYDYFIRGEKVAIKDFSLIVGIRFLQWVSEVSGLKSIRASVRSDNQRIIDFVLKEGFRLGEKHPLKRRYITPDEYALEIDESLTDPEVYKIDIETSAEELRMPSGDETGGQG